MTLTERFAEKAELSKKESKAMMNAFIESIEDAIKEDGRAQISGIGTLVVVTRAAREAHNPATGAKIHVPEKKAIRFKTAKALKESL